MKIGNVGAVVIWLIVIALLITAYKYHKEDVKDKEEIEIEEAILSSVEVGECYIQQVKNRDPFKQYKPDTSRIIAVNNGYVKYIQNNGYVGSCEITYLLKTSHKVDTCYCK